MIPDLRGIRMIWEDKGMKEGIKISLTRKILGNILLILFVLLIIDVVFVMTARIKCPVQCLHQMETCNS